ncbi:TFIIB-type zinc ribbon-containing protein [Streptomyces corynorhini]|uniref:Uncharacterized protein n=1 Tax=Streptomyces corynorhini TaxID=2282652 RepID=A0A370B6Z7_9ACTN|nr:zf-TFIIB domain-containing protein [Streptomyces corynorhini]RDG35185.1 hypothetical protein DVH02_26680 [Streptomyces corynorhini]
MSTTTPRPTSTPDLWTIARHWPDLTAALSARGGTWPPAMGIPVLTHHPDSPEAEAATWRAEALRALERSTPQHGWSKPPLRLSVLDTMLTVQAALLELADQTARQVQRPPAVAPSRRSAGALPRGERARRVQAAEDRHQALKALRDGADPLRWHLPGPAAAAPGTVLGRRRADRAALWLLARVQHAPGPVRRHLTELEAGRIGAVARTCARMVEHALDVGDERARLATPCPVCGGQLTMYGGGGAVPVVRCAGCGGIW